MIFLSDGDCEMNGGNSPGDLPNGDGKLDDNKTPELHKGPQQRKRKRWQRGCLMKKRKKRVLDTSNSQVSSF